MRFKKRSFDGEPLRFSATRWRCRGSAFSASLITLSPCSSSTCPSSPRVFLPVVDFWQPETTTGRSPSSGEAARRQQRVRWIHVTSVTMLNHRFSLAAALSPDATGLSHKPVLTFTGEQWNTSGRSGAGFTSTRLFVGIQMQFFFLPQLIIEIRAQFNT